MINGEVREVIDNMTLEQLVIQLELPVQRIAVEHNRTVVRRVDWTKKLLQEGDRVEIVHFVGGGATGFESS